MPQRIVDAHVHVWSPDVARYPLAPGFAPADMWLPSFTPQDHLSASGQVGRVRMNLVQMTWYGLDHRYIIDLIESDPDTFVGTGVVPAVGDVALPRPDRAMVALSKCGILAFRIRGRAAQPQFGQPPHWLDQDGYQRMFAAGAEHDLALSFLLGPADLAEVGRMSERFPDTPVILDHVGGVRVRDGAIEAQDLEGLCALARHPRVMVKLGPVHALGNRQAPFVDCLPLLRAVIEAFGADRCMWESDLGGPVLMQDQTRDYLACVDVVRNADFLSPQQKGLVLGGAAQRLFWDR